MLLASTGYMWLLLDVEADLYGSSLFCTVLDGSGLLQSLVVSSGPTCRFFSQVLGMSWMLLEGSCQFNTVIDVFGYFWWVLYCFDSTLRTWMVVACSIR